MIAFFLLLAQSEPSTFRAGFAEVEITPPLGTPKQGSNGKTVASSVRDPLYARAAVFERDGERAAIVQLDTMHSRMRRSAGCSEPSRSPSP